MTKLRRPIEDFQPYFIWFYVGCIVWTLIKCCSADVITCCLLGTQPAYHLRALRFVSTDMIITNTNQTYTDISVWLYVKWIIGFTRILLIIDKHYLKYRLSSPTMKTIPIPIWISKFISNQYQYRFVKFSLFK